MKTEINNENKEKFFALYWGQGVLCSLVYGDGWGINSGTIKKHSSNDINYSKWLSLKSISKISDEDLLKIYHLHSASIGYDYTMDFKPPLEMAKHWMEKEENWKKSVAKYSIVDHYLRSRGYALPWMGLLVDEMVEAGWIKLIE